MGKQYAYDTLKIAELNNVDPEQITPAMVRNYWDKKRRDYSKKSWTFRKAWKRTIEEPRSPDDFPTNLVGVQISQGISKQQIVELPRDGEYYGCGRHSFSAPDRVYKYMGGYLCPNCGRPLATWSDLQKT